MWGRCRGEWDVTVCGGALLGSILVPLYGWRGDDPIVEFHLDFTQHGRWWAVCIPVQQ